MLWGVVNLRCTGSPPTDTPWGSNHSYDAHSFFSLPSHIGLAFCHWGRAELRARGHSFWNRDHLKLWDFDHVDITLIRYLDTCYFRAQNVLCFIFPIPTYLGIGSLQNGNNRSCQLLWWVGGRASDEWQNPNFQNLGTRQVPQTL